MSKEKQIEFERNEIAEIIAQNFKCNDEKYDASDFEWAAHCVQMEGYRKQEWISVDERLPETDNKNTYDYNVLVFIPKRDGCRQHGMFLGKLKHSEAEDGSKNFWNIPIEESEWTVWGWSYFKHPVVTHWMPLPEAPKMKNTEN